MPRVGRRRKSNLGLPAGVREIDARWYWQPTSKRERLERKAKGLKASVSLGKAGTVDARTRWAELTGLRDPAVQEGTVNELLTLWGRDGILKRPNGKPRAASTVYQYRWALQILREKFGTSRYGRTEFEASRGLAIGTAEIQRFINASGTQGKRFLAVLDNSFDHGIREGLTTYNPCDKVIPPAQDARTRAPQEWEVECLGTLATPVIGLILAFKNINGWRISKVLALQRRQLHADGIRVHPAKGAQPELWEWSPESRRIIGEAEQLPHATRFPASPVFPNTRGKPYGYSGFNTAWQSLKTRANTELAAGVIDPDTLELHPALSIEDLHVHDVRSKVHDDAEAMGRKGHEVLGNTERIADKHYARREKKRQPLR